MRAHPDARYYCSDRKRYVYPVREWLEIGGTFDPLKASRVAWISDTTLKWCVRWIQRHQKAGRVCVIWTGSVEFGRRLAEVAKVPYYGREGKDAKTGRGLHAADARKSMVCSWHANKRGFNLQAWTQHAIVMPPPSAKYLEQIFGRPHRAGQLSPVHFTILLTSGGTLDAFHAAQREAEFAKLTTKSTQKILRAKIVGPPELPESLRWAVKDTDED
jgi:hypothetical protein